MVDVKEVAGVGFRALVDSALLCPNQEEVVCKRIKPYCCARACMNMCVCGVCVCVHGGWGGGEREREWERTYQ